jgi:hypothetical protein
VIEPRTDTVRLFRGDRTEKATRSDRRCFPARGKVVAILGRGRRTAEESVHVLGPTDIYIAAAEPVRRGMVDRYHRLGDELINVSAINSSWAWTQGGIVSTAEALARFADGIFAGRLLEPAMLKEMLTFLSAEKMGREWGMGVARL